MKKKAENKDFDEAMEVDGCGSSDEDEQKEFDELNMRENRKHKKSGGFQSMGLSGPVFKGIFRKGFNLPTPIQRKTIPVIMEGKDVVAMARTGSGKTGAFIIPMLEKLKAHDPTGIRAIILSPTRELAMQTHKFAKEIGRFVKLRYATILGGDKIEDQFAAIHSNPDVLIATPGRLMHILTEMNLKLKNVKFIVFDEADRLFELNFQEQLGQILARLPESRQTLLFSATLPKMLVEFASAGLNSPELIRLDVDTKLSDQLSMFFLECRSDDKMAVLLHLLRNIITPSQPTFIFVATKHHVEYLNMVLRKAGFSCSISYSSLDPAARSMNVERFKNRRTNIFIVTDLAARGIDIPLLDNVINFNFPAKAKLFLHRVGRVARAGRTGSAFSIVSLEEKPYVVDLFMFLGRQINFATDSYDKNKDEKDLYGLVPQVIVDEEEENLREWNKITDIESMLSVVGNAYKKYSKTRPVASNVSIKRVKAMANNKLGYHPLFGPQVCSTAKETEDFMSQLKNYKPQNVKSNSGVRIQMKTKLAATKSVEADDSEPPTKMRKVVKDEEFYLDYATKDHNTEKGLSLESGFEKEASRVMVDVVGDEDGELKRQKSRMIWDRKKKKFVRAGDGNNKKGKNEAGAKINGKSKKDLYKTWLHKSKVHHKDDESDDEGPSNKQARKHFKGRHGRYDNKDTKGAPGKPGGRPELKKKEQILKARHKKGEVKSFQAKQHKKNQGKRNRNK